MKRTILGMRVDATSYNEATKQIMRWAVDGESRYVCVANVHMVMETCDSLGFRSIVNGSDLVTPDGMPLVWALRALRVSGQQRVYGPDLTLYVCAQAALEGIPVGFYGGTPESLEAFKQFLMEKVPQLKTVCWVSPPFRELTPKEDQCYTEQLVESGARIVFVGIGCPKQEKWMAEHKDRIPAVMLGVGAAFDFHSGRVKQAPNWMQRTGLEWLFRFFMEPRRLGKRYLKHNPRFVLFFLLQLLGIRSFQEG